MNIHEYQAKSVLAQYGVAVPKGGVAYTVEEAEKVATELGGPIWVVKAQIHAGGRGKGGGVKVVRSLDEVKEAAAKMLGMMLVTHQTGRMPAIHVLDIVWHNDSNYASRNSCRPTSN